MKTTLAAITIASALALTGCSSDSSDSAKTGAPSTPSSSATSPSTGAQAAKLHAAIAKADPASPWAKMDASMALIDAQNVCSDLDSGNTMKDELPLFTNPNAKPGQEQTFIRIATKTECPKHLPAVS